MKHRVSVLLMLAPLSAAAGFENMLNPMMLTNPVANPLTMAVPLGGAMVAPGLIGSPLGGYGSPFGGFGNPFGGYGNPLAGLGGPLGLAAPVAGLGAMQVAPNLLSFQHQAPQMLTNPYMGGPFSQLPFTQNTRALPFGGGAYGMPSIGQGVPAGYGTYAVPWGSAMPSMMPVNPYLMPAQPPAQARAQAAFNPLDLLKPAAPAPRPAPTVSAYGYPWMMPQPAAQPAAAPTPTASFNPLDLLKPVVNAPQAAPAPASPVPASAPNANPWIATTVLPAKAETAAPKAAAPVAPPAAPAKPAMALTPLDPAYWLAPLQPAAPAK